MNIPFENIIFILISTGSDALLYGYCYEILKLHQKNLFFKVLFWEWSFDFAQDSFAQDSSKETFVPVYRLCIQWPIDILFIYHIYVNYPWWYFGLTLLAIFLTVKEFGFYFLMGKINEAINFSDHIPDKRPYWLERIYFVLGWDSPYSYEKFRNYAIAGTVILILSNIQQFINLF